MRRILIVDDEKYIRMGIRAIIERSGNGFKEIHEAKNGDEALALLSAQRFDAVVTDIRMPNMDGITFMQEVYKLEAAPRFIILSGYEDFNYARDAIKFGARAYLLKPVKREELLEVLGTVEAELDKEDSLSRNMERVDSIMTKLRENEMNFIFLNKNLSNEEISGIFESVGMDLGGRQFRVAIFAKHRQSIGEDCDKSGAGLREFIDIYFKNTKGFALSFFNPDKNLVLITDEETDFSGMVRFIKELTGEQYIAGISEVMKKITGIREAYRQACEALLHRILKPQDILLMYSEINCLNKDYEIPFALIKKIPQITGTARTNDLVELLGRILDEKILCSCHVDYTRRIVESFKSNVIEHFSRLIPQKSASLIKQYELLNDIYNFDSIQDYSHALKDYILGINDFLHALKNTYKEKNEVDSAIAYVYDNYFKDLNMSVVANYVSLNYSYFSYLFSKHVGMSFVDFLKKVRIEKAQEMIKSTDYKINEIAFKVGYKNPHNFATAFKSITGISPLEYRNK